MSNRFEPTEHVSGTGGIPYSIEVNGIKRWYDPGSNYGMCLYENGKVKELYKGFYWPRWSADGRKIIAIPEEREIGIIEWESKDIMKIKMKQHISKPCWFPDGERIAFIGHDEKGRDYKTPQNVFVYDLKTGEEAQVTLFENVKAIMMGLDVSPDGKKIIFDQGIGGYPNGDWWLYLLDVETKEMTQLVKYGRAPKWSPDGKKIVYEGNYFDSATQKDRSDLMMYDLQTKQAAPLTHEDAIKSHPCWSPDGKQILFVLWEGESKSLWVINADGTNPRVVVPAQPYPGNDISSPDWAE